jgi:hypothetical protein
MIVKILDTEDAQRFVDELGENLPTSEMQMEDLAGAFADKEGKTGELLVQETFQ